MPVQCKIKVLYNFNYCDNRTNYTTESYYDGGLKNSCIKYTI